MFELLIPLATANNMIVFQASDYMITWIFILALFNFGVRGIK